MWRTPLIVGALALLVAAPGVARAQVTVTTTADDFDGVCAPAHCSLREAVELAQPDTQIRLPAGTYALTRGELRSDVDGVVIAGRGARSTTIDGGGRSRLLNVRAGSLVMSSVRLTGGNGRPGVFGRFAFPAAAGVPDGAGGAVAVQPGAYLTLRSSAVVDNAAGGPGGGIASQGVLEIVASLIAGNQTLVGGGGVAAYGDPESPDPASLSLDDSTISGNRADGNGGGVYAGLHLTMRFTTIAGNTAGAGGGLYRPENPPVPVEARSSLLAANVPSNCFGAPEPPAVTGYNVVSDGSCVLSGTGDQQGVDPRLEPLRDNGGPTDTHAVRPGSPAIDGGDCDDARVADQRGIPRPQGDGCDAGAVEAAHTPLEPVGRIAGRPIDVFADGFGQLQVRFNDDPVGAFAPEAGQPSFAGLAFMHSETFYPAGDPGTFTGPIGVRTAVSGPRMTTDGDRRTLRSEYYVGTDLLVTEEVAYVDGEQRFVARYEIENVSSTAADFRAGQLASLTAPGAAGGDGLAVVAPNDAFVALDPITPWRAAQIGTYDSQTDVIDAFVNGTLGNAQPSGARNDQIGADWAVEGLEPGQSKTIEVAWRIGGPRQEVTVNTTADPPVGACEAAPDGDCSLREALQLAPAGAIVRVPAAKEGYRLTQGPLEVVANRIVRGAGARETVIHAAPGSRVLQVSGGALGLSGVTITGGTASPDTGSAGGGIFVAGSLALADSAVTGNRSGLGGGIYAYGDVSIVRSTISHNVAEGTTSEESGAGGGIAAPFARVWVVNSTVSANEASGPQGVGGGIAVLGITRLVNSTITDNTAPQAAGLYHSSFYGPPNPDEPPPPQNQFFSELRGSIVAGNPGGPQCGPGGVPISSFSLAGDASCELGGEGDRENATVPLGPLANNGGPTDTHALPAGSPAIDGGGGRECATSDQRGVARPSGAFCDAGAFEQGSVVAPAAPVVEAPEEDAWVRSLPVTLSGSAAPGAAIEVVEGGVVRGSTQADPDGAWSLAVGGLGEGSRTFSVTATLAGATSQPAVRTVRVDTRAPVVTITSGPSGATSSARPSFAFTASEPASFECRLEGLQSEPGPCVSGVGYELAADGAYRFVVVAVDEAGNRSAPAVREFRLDRTPPAAPAVGGGDGVQPSSFTLSGQAEPGSEVTVYDGESALGVTTAGSDGAWSFALSGVAPGEHVYSAVARDAAGNVSPRSPVRSVRVAEPVAQTPAPTPTPMPTPTPTPDPEVPPPVPAESVNVSVKSGTVRVQLRGTNRFVELEAGRQIPVGSTVDATKGRVTLTSAADASGATQTADFYEGVFRVTQTGGARPVTVLTLTERLSCPGGRASAARAGKKSRRLWGSGRGRFRTVGQYSAATVRGTVWLTEDRCGSTLVRVTQGSVSVRDKVKRKTVIVRRGGRYVARAKSR